MEPGRSSENNRNSWGGGVDENRQVYVFVDDGRVEETRDTAQGHQGDRIRWRRDTDLFRHAGRLQKARRAARSDRTGAHRGFGNGRSGDESDLGRWRNAQGRHRLYEMGDRLLGRARRQDVERPAAFDTRRIFRQWADGGGEKA